ncbi:hypothetical protein BDV95DRAFT_590402 [Massariosphaeria phaeospora]|uniref:Uncharacterized protein n=1 Tax=Massariosphaeria phaeospora TaxID=100035 RepID=A0A7C8M5Y9_9PLEO|nr:hypothetical protein BDV95DRAFT_294548 [Massariosphaeria phaeospora]KAF2876255.1 hypothetical protein BDV95DRAFT_590402 [Massariosphaeria phaeospora]
MSASNSVVPAVEGFVPRVVKPGYLSAGHVTSLPLSILKDQVDDGKDGINEKNGRTQYKARKEKKRDDLALLLIAITENPRLALSIERIKLNPKYDGADLSGVLDFGREFHRFGGGSAVPSSPGLPAWQIAFDDAAQRARMLGLTDEDLEGDELPLAIYVGLVSKLLHACVNLEELKLAPEWYPHFDMEGFGKLRHVLVVRGEDM